MGNDHSISETSIAHRTHHHHVRPKLSDATPQRPLSAADFAEEWGIERLAKGRRSLDVRGSYSSEPRRKPSQCTLSPSLFESENEDSEGASGLGARSKSTTDANRRPSRNSLGVQSPPSPQISPARSPTNLSVPRRQQRRMSVDESQQRRLQHLAARTGVLNAPNGHKLSLSGFAMMNGATGDERQDARTRISRATRDFAETGDFGLTLQEHLKLTSYQTLMLTQTWPKMKSSVFTAVFRELSQRCPKVKELFQKTSIVGGFSANKCYDIKEHVKQLIELYDLSIQDLNAPCKISQERLVNIGEQHFSICGPGASSIWDDLGVALTEAISKADATRGKREAFKAYIALTSFLVDSMKAGYSQQAKRKSLTRASNGHLNKNM
ncbi:unnamed protein product [Bursaphelenchus xylophilus]|uniref:(pine wood nematode) hypothetical protein n=1 Tax=Bursaphelenchus xylophilus TaxID=6326 RepID=A0A1I7RTM2_BURXY|nr:unnamed protein product [Bursaphelenchus xylophilus]CAG9122323.1 unnamed protein product [Bursaphelenchus xylophilus]